MSFWVAAVAALPILKAWDYRAQFRSGYPTWQTAARLVDNQKGGAWFERIVSGNVSVRSIHHGPTYLPEIALTFDDGPHGQVERDLLKVLKEYHARATFFVVGKMVRDRKKLLKEIYDAGNEIGNHSFSHPNLTGMSVEDVLTEFKATNLLIQEVTGETPRYCRPPGGQLNPQVLKAASALGLSTVFWGSNPGDYKFTDPEEILKRLRAKRKPGSIVLLHSGLPATVEALKVFLPESEKMGYRFVLVREWDRPAGERQAAGFWAGSA